MISASVLICIHNFFSVSKKQAVASQAKLVIKLSGDAKDAQSSKEGIYTLSLDTVNGKSYWIQEEGTSAIWFDKKYGNWKIGSKDNLGTSASGLYSNGNVNKPQDATIWNYYITDNKTWIKANENEVYAGSTVNFRFKEVFNLQIHLHKRFF